MAEAAQRSGLRSKQASDITKRRGEKSGGVRRDLRRYDVRIWIRIIVDAQNVDNVASMNSYTLEPVGFIRSTVKGRHDAPRQGPEGAPDAWLEIEPQFADALLGMEAGHELIVITLVAPGRARCAEGTSAQRREPSAYRRVLHALTGATESARNSSRDRYARLRDAFEDRPD